jgi:hypothetical protein
VSDTSLADSLASDILRGAKAIADYIGMNERDTYDKLEKGYLPANKEGSIWVSTKSRLTQHYNEDRYVPPPRDEAASAASIKRRRKHTTK